METRRPSKRKHYFTNVKFQLKYTSLLIGVVLSVIAVLFLVIWRISEASVEHAQFAAKQAEKALEQSRAASHMAQMSALENAADSPALQAALMEETAKVDRGYERDLADVKARVESVKRGRRQLLTILISAAVALMTILFVTGVYLTQKIVGPAFRMKRLLRQVGTGRLVVKERLRRGDELGDLFDTFLQMTYSLKARQLERLATLDAIIEQATNNGAAKEIIEELGHLRAQLVAGLGNVAPLTATPDAAP